MGDGLSIENQTPELQSPASRTCPHPMEDLFFLNYPHCYLIVIHVCVKRLSDHLRDAEEDEIPVFQGQPSDEIRYLA